MVYYILYSSPIGELTIVSDKENIIGLWIENQKYFKSTINEKMIEDNNLPILKKTKNWLDRYFNGDKPQINELPLKPKGTKFRLLVWQILTEIPYGEVITYQDISKKICKIMKKEKMSSQAIGGAVGHNPISIIIPCHRVIGTDGTLKGYAGGLDKKEKLLKLEGFTLYKK